jgi:DNA processing protein
VSDRKYWLGFSLIPEIGPKRTTQLLQWFGDLQSAWQASEAQLRDAGLDKQPRANLLRLRAQLDLDAQIERLRREGFTLITSEDESYPPLLKRLPDAPMLLYVRGTLTPADHRALSIVGTRKATQYGRDAAYTLARDLAQQGITIISGLAHGIDAAAHKGALEGGGRTLAVLGSGIDIIYPSDHRELAAKIANRGAMISEFPLGMPPEAHNFPRRNRLISGLALGVLVVEAPEQSGALITANIAADQGRDVFAVPGNIFSAASSGTNRLIQDGAKLVMTANDVLEELEIAHQVVQTRTKTEKIAPANETEAALLKYLSMEPLHIDDLVRLCGLPIAIVTSTLTILELKGLARTVSPMHYSLLYD